MRAGRRERGRPSRCSSTASVDHQRLPVAQRPSRADPPFRTARRPGTAGASRDARGSRGAEPRGGRARRARRSGPARTWPGTSSGRVAQLEPAQGRRQHAGAGAEPAVHEPVGREPVDDDPVQPGPRDAIRRVKTFPRAPRRSQDGRTLSGRRAGSTRADRDRRRADRGQRTSRSAAGVGLSSVLVLTVERVLHHPPSCSPRTIPASTWGAHPAGRTTSTAARAAVWQAGGGHRVRSTAIPTRSDSVLLIRRRGGVI